MPPDPTGTPVVVRAVRAVVAPLTRTRLFRAGAPRLLPVFERLLGRLSGGRLQIAGLLVPSLVLHTVGAHSGVVRSAHLMYTPDGQGRAIVAGTSFARERHPAWTANLAAHPVAVIDVRGRLLTVRASRIPEAERDAAWRRIEAQWPGYRGYERESGRAVRLFLLRPVDEPAPASLAAVAAGAHVG
ncbi:nitroreductase family deazaflavin-dependent oxidoreductase [Agromyces sp. MMS17-SY077]|uniref:Nitroreductase family deazaflavin-dependent oxidoreductase n=1 Tax=Agromyces seonyuensis TaxID=2662446 RepID=A0A6I4NYW5_9MICO|nr:nitroreductase family deazaflavin-dependent oxidoreductase [Agromyces seonyuensis]MWB98392.1 nitroreductase family deazaflavin-dependent oxidoreductase [Agromyces seonyuensis]